MIKFHGVRAICLLGLLIALASGCSKQESAKMLARRLYEADRVTISSKYADGSPPVQLTTEEAKRLVQAVANAEKKGPATATPDLLVRFFKGTNLLAEFSAGYTVFWIDHGPDPKQPDLRRATTYLDRSGTLKMISEKFLYPAETNGVR
jgi:hypothetical protein